MPFPKCSFRRRWVGVLLLPLLFFGASQSHAGTAGSTTATTLFVSPGISVTEGTPLALQATVVDLCESPVTEGSITFYDGTKVLVTVQVVNSGSAYPQGTANLKFYLGPGTHGVKAVYSGTNSYATSVSETATITVTMPSSAVTTTTITSTGNPGNYTLKGKITAFSSIPLTGTVSFTDQTNNNFLLGATTPDATTLANSWKNFTAPVAASGNYGVVMGDLNGDGIPDLVTSNFTGNTLSVFLGKGDGSFLTHVDYMVGSLSFGMALGDLNGDGIPDIAVASSLSSIVSVLLGNGDGTFQAIKNYATGGISQYVVMADFNGDGILDLATCASGSGFVSVLLGNGDGTFQTQHVYGTGSFAYGLAVGDFNRDGSFDLAVSDSDDDSVSVFLGNGDGTFQAQTNYATGPAPTNIAVVDLNADGNQDLVVCDAGGSTISVLLGNGDGTFPPKVDYASSGSPWGVAVADVNGDGIPDVATTNPNSQTVDVFQGKGDGTLLAAVTTTTGVTNYVPALGDLNGDGVIDLAVPSMLTSSVVVSLGSISEVAALLNVSVPGGSTHNVVASYAGDANSSSSTSPLISLTGTPFTTTLVLSAAPMSGTPGQAFLLTAGVSPSSSSGYTAGGTVTFFDGGVSMGAPVTLSSGSAALNKSDFTNGVHTITATYSGDTNFAAGSTISPTMITVAVPDYSIVANPAALTVQRGATGTSVLTITPVGGFTGEVTFTCSGLPQFTTCAFTPATVMLPGNDAARTVQFSLITSVMTGTLGTLPRGSGHGGFGHGPTLALLSSFDISFPFGILVWVSVTRRRNSAARFCRMKSVQMLVLGAALLGIVGCGGTGGHQVPLGTSTVTMTATTVGGSVHHTAAISITITP